MHPKQRENHIFLVPIWVCCIHTLFKFTSNLNSLECVFFCFGECYFPLPLIHLHSISNCWLHLNAFLEELSPDFTSKHSSPTIHLVIGLSNHLSPGHPILQSQLGCEPTLKSFECLIPDCKHLSCFSLPFPEQRIWMQKQVGLHILVHVRTCI